MSYLVHLHCVVQIFEFHFHCGALFLCACCASPTESVLRITNCVRMQRAPLIRSTGRVVANTHTEKPRCVRCTFRTQNTTVPATVVPHRDHYNNNNEMNRKHNRGRASMCVERNAKEGIIHCRDRGACFTTTTTTKRPIHVSIFGNTRTRANRITHIKEDTRGTSACAQWRATGPVYIHTCMNVYVCSMYIYMICLTNNTTCTVDAATHMDHYDDDITLQTL